MHALLTTLSICQLSKLVTKGQHNSSDISKRLVHVRHLLIPVNKEQRARHLIRFGSRRTPLALLQELLGLFASPSLGLDLPESFYVSQLRSTRCRLPIEVRSIPFHLTYIAACVESKFDLGYDAGLDAQYR